MKIDNMRELYEELLRATSNGYRNRSIANPAVDFTKKAKAGDFDEMSDEEYYQALDKVNELNDVWQHRPSGQIGELLFTALENLTLSDSDVEDMAATLLCAYERSSKEHIPCDAKAADRNERTAGYAASKEIDSDNPSKTKTQSDKRSTDAKGILSSPVKIYEYLDRRVYGQKEAKRAAAMLLWNHVNGRRQNVLFAGPTGCGKTEIFRQLAKLYPNIVIHNATSLTGTGWKGNTKVRNLFDGVPQDKMGHLIIVLDEADKMFEDADDRHYSYIVQNELLKVLEGDMVHFDGNPSNSEPALDIDTSNVSFVFLGSFDSMVRAKEVAVNKSRAIGFGAVSSDESFDGYRSTFTQEDLVQYANVRCEIAGRIGNIVQLREMTEDDFYAILNDKRISPVRKLSDYYGVKLKMSETAKHKLAKEAAENGMGVRFIHSQIQRRLDYELFENCCSKHCCACIDRVYRFHRTFCAKRFQILYTVFNNYCPYYSGNASSLCCSAYVVRLNQKRRYNGLSFRQRFCSSWCNFNSSCSYEYCNNGCYGCIYKFVRSRDFRASSQPC